jgi:HK97 family phage prohead protease
MAEYKGTEIDTRPTEAMAEEAQRGLDWRAEFGRGGTEIGVARARDLANRRELSLDTVRRMASFFARHAVDKQAEGFSPGEEGYPSAGRIAWALWGGDPGESWANERVSRMDAIDNQDRKLDANELSPLNSSALEETEMDERHIVGVTETEDSFVVEFAKAHDETVMPEDEAVEEVVEMVEEMVENTMIPGERKGEPLTTRADEMEPIVEAERRVRMAISSEMPVERMGGMEILEHSAGAIDLSFLNSGRAPLLLDHDPTQQIGVIESVSLDESARKLRATVRFGKSGRASEVYDDVVDGIRGNVSIGYYVKKVTREADGKVYRATSWQPLEVSVVSIPADSSVGVGRSAEISQPVIEVIPNSNPKGTEMSQENTGAVTAEAAIAKRNAELKQISELAARHNKSQLVATAIERGMSYGEFQGFLLERNLDKPLHAPDVEMTKTEQKRYSLLRAIDSMAKNGRVTGFEAEISAEIARNTGKEARGFYVPMSVFAKRDILTTSPANGSNIIAEDYMAGEFIDRLRANLVIGSTSVPG